MGQRGALPTKLAAVLSKPSDQPILLNKGSSVHYVNLLWAVGLATFMFGNFESPLNGDSLFNFASTGGWPFGREANGGAYFSKFPIVGLSRETEARVIRIAKSTFRPCCNNSTFFQDCNHGSALLGLVQLGASQGLTDDDLYKEALAFNSFWFPDNYVLTALFFKVFEKMDWADVEPKTVLGFDYSALEPWQRNVEARLKTMPNLIPPPQADVSCGA